MRIVRVTGHPFSCQCYKCGRILVLGGPRFFNKETNEWESEPVYADLDGPAWKAYYCKLCAPKGGDNATK